MTSTEKANPHVTVTQDIARTAPLLRVLPPSLDCMVIAFIFLCSFSSKSSSYLRCSRLLCGQERMGQKRRISAPHPDSLPPESTGAGPSGSGGLSTRWGESWRGSD